MSKLIKIILLFTCSLPAFAGWEVARPDSAIPHEAFFQAGTERNNAIPTSYSATSFPKQYARYGNNAPLYAISISGSLKENLERIMARYHWRVIWKVPYDYNFDGHISGTSLPNVVEKLFKPFPLQAVMYMSNRTVAVIPRVPA